MANVNVTYQEMRDAGTKLTTGRQELESVLDQLMSQVRQLVSGGYVTDSSSKQFEAAYEQFTTGAKNTISGLEDMSTYLNNAAQAFEDADTQLASSLGR